MKEEGLKMRFLRAFLCIFCFALIFISNVYATGPATVYRVKIKKLEIGDASTFTTIFEGGSVNLDIAAVNSGQAAGTFFSGLKVPDGTYTRIRVTPHPQFTIKGNDGINYTSATIAANGGCTPTNAAGAAECTITLNTDPTAQIQDFSATPITVKDGIADKKVRVSFNVANAIELIDIPGPNDEIYPAAPAVTMTVE